jgi:inhibitor of cysteine peptidase
VALVLLGEADAGRARAAARGDIVVIRLDETPTSGYRWEIEEFDPVVLRVTGEGYRAAPAGGLGAPGSHELRFVVVGRGDGRIRLALRRPWESGSSSTRRFETTIQASG